MTHERGWWNGQPAEVARGTGRVRRAPEGLLNPLLGLEGLRVPCVRVRYHGETQYLDDPHGSAWAKVTVGRGSPAYGHTNIDVEDFCADDDHAAGRAEDAGEDPASGA